VPSALNDRQADISVPLLSIADMAGGGWPDRLRRALLTLFGSDRDRAAVDLGSLLLADCHAIFAETGSLRITSGELASRLAGIETSPWGEIAAGRPITPHRLAKMLAPFGIRPATIRFGHEVSKGYLRADFEASWRRYLPSLAEGGGFGTVTSLHALRNLDFRRKRNRYTPSRCNGSDWAETRRKPMM